MKFDKKRNIKSAKEVFGNGVANFKVNKKSYALGYIWKYKN